jgi:hypothetical protein
VIAVELADDLYYPINRFEVLVPHRAIGDEQRLVEAAHLKRDEFGRRAGRPPGQNLLNTLSDAALGETLARRFRGSIRRR